MNVLKYTLFSVLFAQIKTNPLPKDVLSQTILKLPKQFSVGAKVVIIGSNDNIENFSATLTGTRVTDEDSCKMMFMPMENRSEILSNTELEKSNYDFEFARDGKLSFELEIKAVYTNDDNSFHSISVHFGANQAGSESVGNCNLKSLESLEYIIFHNVKHISQLTFNYED